MPVNICYNDRVEKLQQRPHGPQSQSICYLAFYKKKFVDSWSSIIRPQPRPYQQNESPMICLSTLVKLELHTRTTVTATAEKQNFITVCAIGSMKPPTSFLLCQSLREVSPSQNLGHTWKPCCKRKWEMNLAFPSPECSEVCHRGLGMKLVGSICTVCQTIQLDSHSE